MGRALFKAVRAEGYKSASEQPLRQSNPTNTMSASDYESVNIQKTEALQRLFDLTDDDDRAILTAFIQGNFDREEIFPETRRIQMSSGFSVNDKKIETIFSGTTEEAESETTMTTTMKIQNEKPSHKWCARCDFRFNDEGEICFREWDGDSDAPLCGPCWDKTEEEEEYGSQTCDECGEPTTDEWPFVDENAGALFRCEECFCRVRAERRWQERADEVDAPDAPNIWPYKKCYECEQRSSCGAYDSEHRWVCEDCSDERYVCGVCGKTEPSDEEWDVGPIEDFMGDVVCPDCQDRADPDPTNWNEETLSAYEDLNGAIDASGNAF